MRMFNPDDMEPGVKYFKMIATTIDFRDVEVRQGENGFYIKADDFFRIVLKVTGEVIIKTEKGKILAMPVLKNALPVHDDDSVPRTWPERRNPIN